MTYRLGKGWRPSGVLGSCHWFWYDLIVAAKQLGPDRWMSERGVEVMGSDAKYAVYQAVHCKIESLAGSTLKAGSIFPPYLCSAIAYACTTVSFWNSMAMTTITTATTIIVVIAEDELYLRLYVGHENSPSWTPFPRCFPYFLTIFLVYLQTASRLSSRLTRCSSFSSFSLLRFFFFFLFFLSGWKESSRGL